MWLVDAQGDVRRAVEDAGVRRAAAGLRQRPGQGHLPRRQQAGGAGRADGRFLGPADECDGLPARRHHVVVLRERPAPAQLAPGAHRGHQHHLRAVADGLRADDHLRHQGQGPGRLDARNSSSRRSAASSCCGRSTSCSRWSNSSPSRCRTACGSTGTCTPAKSSSCCWPCWPRPARAGSRSRCSSTWSWALFHILIVALQAYIFMMLTIVYMSMAEEHH